ncbi:MAG: hypothetical protein IPK70_06195 [Flavobacteriales bacterium]|nr:hypothetical protein [Flavobacteriales bacterium]
MRTAALGLELTCRNPVPAHTELYLYYQNRLLLPLSRRPGRLLAPRPLTRALRRLLTECKEHMRQRLLALPPGRQRQADDLAKSYSKWEARVHKEHLARHQQRLPNTYRFACWHLPACAAHRLWRQLYPLPDTEPQAPEIALVAIVPVSPCLRLTDGGIDRMAAYLHAPSRWLGGPWHQVPDDRITACLWNKHLLVKVE